MLATFGCVVEHELIILWTKSRVCSNGVPGSVDEVAVNWNDQRCVCAYMPMVSKNPTLSIQIEIGS